MNKNINPLFIVLGIIYSCQLFLVITGSIISIKTRKAYFLNLIPFIWILWVILNFRKEVVDFYKNLK